MKRQLSKKCYVQDQNSIRASKDLYICFIEYTYGFDKVRYKYIIKILRKIDLYGKGIRVICNPFQEEISYMQVENNFNEQTNILIKKKQGVRKEYIFSSRDVIKRIIISTKIYYQRKCFSSVRYTYNTVLMSNSERKLKDLLVNIVKQSKTNY